VLGSRHAARTKARQAARRAGKAATCVTLVGWSDRRVPACDGAALIFGRACI